MNFISLGMKKKLWIVKKIFGNYNKIVIKVIVFLSFGMEVV